MADVNFQVKKGLTVPNGSASSPSIIFDAADPNTGLYSPGADQLAISTNGTGRLFVDSSGRILVGTSSSRSVSGAERLVQIEGTSAVTTGLSISRNSNDSSPSFIGLAKTRGTSNGSVSSVQSNDLMGAITFSGADGSSLVNAVDIRGEVDGTPGTNDMPGRLVFSTTADGAASPTERLRITSAGLVGVGVSAPGALLHIAEVAAGSGFSATSLRSTRSNFGAEFTGYIDQGVSHGAIISTVSAGTATERIRITDSGRVAIGTTSPTQALEVAGSIRLNNDLLYADATATRGRIYGDSTGLVVRADTGLALRFHADAGERARIDTSGRLLVGTSSAYSSRLVQIEGTSGPTTNLSIIRHEANANAPVFEFYKTRGTSNGSKTLVQDGDGTGTILFTGADGTNNLINARIEAFIDGTPGTNDMPGRLTFSTTADGGSSPTERMRINNDGDVFFGTTTINPGIGNTGTGVMIRGSGGGSYTAASRSGGTALFINRNSSDGDLVNFNQDGTNEGSISVSGTTVSYNGAHLSRWSQLPSGAERTEILRGSVLSNLDEMCEWGDEDNEQLNRMKVSDVEGDKNVSGVFQAWDDDDDTYTNDFYCAMTGDFIIRIAEGVTVERGDLLMSAGDGTAKPQDDDIIRSKTIAKVTSTNVSCTYDDGSYCVPCVLMAC